MDMMRVGLTGGIAAGKSVASQRFRELGVMVVDYDKLARDVVAVGTPGLAEVMRAFGPQVLAGDGNLDRSRLGAQVFGDDNDRAKLEEIVHPLVITQAQHLDDIADSEGRELIVHDIPLLVEVAGPDALDAVIVVDAPPEVRVNRLVDSRFMTVEEAWERIDAQIDDEVRREAADVIFDGSGTVENLRRQVDEWLAEIERTGVHYRPTSERTAFLVTEDGLD
ncbi:MAG: dephospho-CoA kinase [Propionibacteriaceae bacterium]|nr:dephospho-CoA kinase [Propionibacteriaceae bacterium]